MPDILSYIRSLARRFRASASIPASRDAESGRIAEPVPFDENLLERSRTRWQFGDWDSLAQIDRDTLQHHPDRAKLALLAAAGHAQRGDMVQARQFTRLARDWGCGRTLISQVLIAGAHNSMGRAWAAASGAAHGLAHGSNGRALAHFQAAISVGMPGGDAGLLTEARVTSQIRDVALPNPERIATRILEAVPRPAGTRGQEHPALPSSAHLARFTGPPDNYAALSVIHDLVRPGSYLEIGVEQGKSLALAVCPAVGVDPAPRQLTGLPDTARVVTATSDEFFADMADQYLPQAPDLILLDGMPLLEYALRDLIHAEALAHADSVIMIPGILPSDPARATRRRTGPDWTGDVWKLPEILRTHRPDLRLLLLDTAPNGLLLIRGLDPTSPTLRDKTPEILATYQPMETLPEHILKREGITHMDERVIADFTRKEPR